MIRLNRYRMIAAGCFWLASVHRRRRPKHRLPAPAGLRALSALPADVFADSRNRLPIVEREDLDQLGKQLYDDTAGNTGLLAGFQGPGGIHLHSPQSGELAHRLNTYLRFETTSRCTHHRTRDSGHCTRARFAVRVGSARAGGTAGRSVGTTCRDRETPPAGRGLVGPRRNDHSTGSRIARRAARHISDVCARFEDLGAQEPGRSGNTDWRVLGDCRAPVDVRPAVADWAASGPPTALVRVVAHREPLAAKNGEVATLPRALVSAAQK